jgi:hypothetical protein
LIAASSAFPKASRPVVADLRRRTGGVPVAVR